MNAAAPRRRKDLLVLGTMIGFALVFVLVATWLGQKNRTRYKLEPRPPLPPVQQRAVDALGTWNPLLPRPWPAREDHPADRPLAEALERGDPAKALSLIEAAAADDPWARHQRIVAEYHAGGEPEKALADLDALVRERPRDLPPRAARGILRLIHGEATEALADLEAAHAGAPSDAVATLRFGLARERVSGLDAARPLYEQAATALPGDPDACLRFGRALLATKDAAAAKVWAQRAVDAARNWADAQFLLGEACLAAGDSSRARRAFLDVLQLRPDDRQAERHAARIDGRPLEEDR